MQKVVHNVSTFLPEYTHTVLTTGQDGAIANEVIGGVSICRQRSYAELASMPISPSLFWQALWTARRHQLIALHYPFPLAELAISLVPLAPPIVVHWHSEVIAQKKLKWLVAPITFVLLARAKAIVVTSKHMIEPSLFLKFYKHKITYIPYGMAQTTPTQIIDKPNSEYFIIIGRHVSYKGIGVAISALRKTQTNLVLCGNGPLFEQNKKLAIGDLWLER